uniref:G_PROTEIN_RECEP_F1_2 domain-containing protein n=1 Tax=Steinernema glaseri TaxID=37863 RepID=A0A1I7XYY3_9BILA
MWSPSSPGRPRNCVKTTSYGSVTPVFRLKHYYSPIMNGDTFVVLYNRILDFTAVFSTIINVITLTVVLRSTPRSIRNFSKLIVNIIAWNFAANFVCAFGHPYPMFPAMCFRLDGILSHFKSEIFGHIVIMLLLVTMANVAVGICLSFHFRYMTISKSSYLSQNPIWGYVYCISAHFSISMAYFVMYYLWAIPVKDYPLQDELPDEESLVCFHPSGARKYVIVVLFATCVILIGVSIVVFLMLSLRRLEENRKFMSQQTLMTQKRLLVNLIVLTAIPFLLGGVPLLIVVLTICLCDWQYTNAICAVSILILLNHGPIMCIATLSIFEHYRLAVKNFVLKTIGKSAKKISQAKLFSKVSYISRIDVTKMHS